MDYSNNQGGARAPLARLSSGQTYYTLESLEGVTTLPPLLFSSTPLPSAFALHQSHPIHMGGREMPSALDGPFPASSIGTPDPGETMRGSIRDPYRQPITDREPTLNMNHGTRPIGDSVGHLQSLNWSVPPREITQQYQQREINHRPSPPPQIYQHRAGQQEVFKSGLSKNSDSRLQPKFNNRVHREIPGIKDISKTPKIPGWCSLCDINCSTKEVLHKKHVFGKKHQSMLKKLKEKGPEDGGKPQKKQPQGLIGWCSLCEVNCGSLENLHEQHVSGKKHQSMLGIERDVQTEQQETAETGEDNVLGKRKEEVKEERNTSSQKRQKLAKEHDDEVSQNGNSESHLQVDSETESVLGGEVEEAAVVM